MIRAYIVTETPFDAEILKRILPQNLLENIWFAVGNGKYSAKSLASTLLAVKQLPVVLVIDADTDEQTALHEQYHFLDQLLQRTAEETAFKIILAVPRLEDIFSEILRTLDNSNNDNLHHEVILSALENLAPTHLGTIQKHPLINELSDFLNSVLNENNAVLPE